MLKAWLAVAKGPRKLAVGTAEAELEGVGLAQYNGPSSCSCSCSCSLFHWLCRTEVYVAPLLAKSFTLPSITRGSYTHSTAHAKHRTYLLLTYIRWRSHTLHSRPPATCFIRVAPSCTQPSRCHCISDDGMDDLQVGCPFRYGPIEQ
jgi:hypothetical protein